MLDVALITFDPEYKHSAFLTNLAQEATKRSMPVLTGDNDLLLTALRNRGLRAAEVAWTDPVIDWSQVKLCAIRTAVDWHERPKEFLRWADSVAKVSKLWNPPGLMRWIYKKSYLKELNQRGIPIVETEWLQANSKVDLAQLLAQKQWSRAVIKPVLGLGGHDLIRLSLRGDAGFSDLTQAQQHLDYLLANFEDGVMVQPYLDSIESLGELSIIFVRGQIKHAIFKKPAKGEFIALAQFGSVISSTTLNPDEIALGTKIIDALDNACFGRIDFLMDDKGRYLLSEIEINSPTLYLSYSSEALAFLADQLALAAKK